MKKREYIVLQNTLITNQTIQTNIRLVKARDEQEAIGKFVTAVKSIEALAKLDIHCIDRATMVAL